MIKKKNNKFLIFGAVGIVVLIAVIYFIWGGDKELSYDFVVVEKGKVVQEISVTGRVKPSKDVDLAFEKGGKIAGVYVDVGDEIFKGQRLVKLDNADISAQLQGAEANLKVQQAKLDELERGTRPEEILVQEVKVSNAKVAVDDAKRNLLDKIKDTYTKSDDAIRSKVDQFISNSRGDSPSLDFSVSDLSLELRIENERVLLEYILNSWQTSLVDLTISDNLESFNATAKNNLNEVKKLLEDSALAVNSLTAGGELTQTEIDGWRADVSTARTNINTATVNLSSAEEGLRADESSLLLAQQELELKKAGTVVEQVIAQQAQVEKAQADINSYQAQLVKTVIRSPISGIITNQDARVGEIVSAGTVIVSVVSDNNFNIESDVSEVDIAKIEVGDIAEITLDAYGEEVLFSAVVVSIDPAETIIEGVPSYRTTLEFKEEDKRIRSGMTANIDIVTEKKENVMVVPQRSVVIKNGFKFVRTVVDGKIEESEVKTGLKGSYGEIEILEGIEEGDKVITYMK